jgi:DNA-binding XRE family transcriptional regulator
VPLALKCLKPKGYTEYPRTLGEHLRKRRAELSLTQAQAAAAVKVNPWTVRNWETGRYGPPIRCIPAILAFLGYDPFPPPITVGERLLHKRRKNGWSTAVAAEHIGVDRTTWQDWERGELILFRKHRALVARFLGLDEAGLVREMRARWNGKHRRWEK